MAPARQPRLDVLVVCSSGGHLFDALALAPAWSARTRAWVSFDKVDVRSLLAGERVYFGHGPTNRNIPNFLRNLALARRVIGETRPRTLVTTGAGIAVPFAWVARLRGADVIYVECAGRIDRPSLSGRLIAPVAARIYAQWPELAAKWKRAQYGGNVMLAQRTTPPAGRGSGVVVTVGTNEAPFDRLVEAAARLTHEPVTVQHGPSKIRSHGAQCVDYLAFAEFDALVASARVVVTHAGIGSIAAALAHGRRPVVVPRLRRHGEAVDDHQVSFAHRLEDAGLVTVVEDLDRLAEVVASRDHSAAPMAGPDLSAEIRTVLDELLDGEPAASRSAVEGYAEKKATAAS